jgi:hypothetical protein
VHCFSAALPMPAFGQNADIGTLASPLAWIVRMPGQA